MLPDRLRDAHDEFATAHVATLVDTGGDKQRVQLDDEVELVDLAGNRTRVQIADIVKQCPAHGDCALLAGDPDVVVGHERRLTGTAKAVIATAIAIGGAGGLIYCTVGCDSPGDYLAGAGLVVLGAVVVGAAVLFVRGFPHTD